MELGWMCRSVGVWIQSVGVFVSEWTRLNGWTRRNTSPRPKPIDYTQGWPLWQYDSARASQTGGQDNSDIKSLHSLFVCPCFSKSSQSLCATLLIIFFVLFCSSVWYSPDRRLLWSPLKKGVRENNSIDQSGAFVVPRQPWELDLEAPLILSSPCSLRAPSKGGR